MDFTEQIQELEAKYEQVMCGVPLCLRFGVTLGKDLELRVASVGERSLCLLHVYGKLSPTCVY